MSTQYLKFRGYNVTSQQDSLYVPGPGGDEGTLNNFKEAYKIIPGTATTEQGRVFGDLSQSDLLQQFGDLPK